MNTPTTGPEIISRIQTDMEAWHHIADRYNQVHSAMFRRSHMPFELADEAAKKAIQSDSLDISQMVSDLSPDMHRMAAWNFVVEALYRNMEPIHTGRKIAEDALRARVTIIGQNVRLLHLHEGSPKELKSEQYSPITHETENALINKRYQGTVRAVHTAPEEGGIIELRTSFKRFALLGLVQHDGTPAVNLEIVSNK